MAEIVGSIALALEVAAAIYSFITKANFVYRQARFGPIGHILALLRLIDTRAIRDLHWKINTWTDDEVIVWKSSYISSCTAIQVAVRTSKVWSH
jgi:hypothetical protein